MKRLLIPWLAILGISAALPGGCASTIDAGDDRVVDQPPPFVSPDASPNSEDAGPATPQTLVCDGYECPDPLISCPGVDGLCSVNPETDSNHCGSCDHACPQDTSFTSTADSLALINAKFPCIDGQCRMICINSGADCNGIIDDGCEIRLDNDPNNCGLCGNQCPPGVICTGGHCGCDPGRTQCGKNCFPLDTDFNNCGACGHSCQADRVNGGSDVWTCGKNVFPRNTTFTCASSHCGVVCKNGFTDCDHDLCTNGCETSILNDPQNCGACGHTCPPGVQCANGQCGCPPGQILCGIPGIAQFCKNLQTDVFNCGSCGNACPGADLNPQANIKGGPYCLNGRCDYACSLGFADCDHDLQNGCEVDLGKDQANCGTCGHECDRGTGQPCADGTCVARHCVSVDGGSPDSGLIR